MTRYRKPGMRQLFTSRGWWTLIAIGAFGAELLAIAIMRGAQPG